jgi:hypothetical protein
MRRTVAAVALVLVILTGCQPTGTDRIEEDDPRWNCATMGNRECGPSVNA